MTLRCETHGTARLVTVDMPRLDAAGAVAFKEAARQCLQDAQGRVVLDLARVEFLDSSGLGALVAITKMRPPGTRVELATCGSLVRKVLKLTQMDRVFVLHDAVPLAELGQGQDAA